LKILQDKGFISSIKKRTFFVNLRMTDNPPINWQKGVQFYGGDEDMFKLMVESYENLPFNTHIKLLYEHILTLDFQAIKTDARTIKGVSA